MNQSFFSFAISASVISSIVSLVFHPTGNIHEVNKNTSNIIYRFIYYNGYFPWSHNACKGIAFMRNSIAYADFHTLAAVTVYIALPKKMKISHKATLIIIWLIWMIALATASSPLSGKKIPYFNTRNAPSILVRIVF